MSLEKKFHINRYFESGEKARETNSADIQSGEERTFLFFKECKSYTDTIGFSLFSAIATNLLLGLTVIAVIPMFPSVPGINL